MMLHIHHALKYLKLILFYLFVGTKLYIIKMIIFMFIQLFFEFVFQCNYII